MLGGASALLEGNVGDPLVVPPALFAIAGYLHQAVALPGICVRVLWEGEKKTGFSGSPRSVQGASLSQGPRGENRLAQNSSRGDEAAGAAHGTCLAWLSTELVQAQPAQLC